ncbi:MAG: hypothetical protein J6J23_07470 [Clostridia bacterium]|nr:hypothetical protein [Clostridia bacterium]
MNNDELQTEIEQIKTRNKKVELDKMWETSWTRKICIAILTYFVVVLYSYIINRFSNIWLSSLVPVFGFILSTLSLKFIRQLWEKKIKK